MGITVKADMSGVAKKIDQICHNQQLGQAVANDGLKYMNGHYVPMLDGALRKSGIAKPFVITWDTPYAHRHWEGYGDGKRNTPGTRSHWDQPKDVREHMAKAASDWLKRQG